jgi:hypothetical protein
MVQQIGHHRRGVEEMLEVVEDEQELPILEERPQSAHQGLAGSIRDGKCLGHCGEHEVGLTNERQGDANHPFGEVAGEIRRNLEREPRLAYPTRAGQGQEADVRAAE